MILKRLYLENYKQFRDPLELLPSEGAIGVVGANGAGKTTLFEAILWAFFGSRPGDARFANDSIPWSGGSAADRSVVEVTLEVDGISYRVSRSLRRGKTEARVCREPDAELVGGPSEVKRWVQEHLLGMDRTAFEATFFARQKELEFFAETTGVERQRKIAQLLGISRVEEAQKLLREDKKAAENLRRALEQILEETDVEALEREIPAARARRDGARSRKEAAQKELEEREEELASARQAAGRAEELYRRATALERRLDAAAAEEARAGERVRQLREQLESLEEDERRARELEPRTRKLVEVERRIAELEEARSREKQRELARGEMQRLRRSAHDALMEACDLLEELDGEDPPPLPGWEELFGIEDEAERLQEAVRLLGEAEDTSRLAERHLQGLRESAELHGRLTEAERELRRLREEREAVRREISRLEREISRTSDEDPPGRLLERLREEREELRQRASQQRGLAEADEREAERLAQARRMIQDAHEAAECPTCRRRFVAGEHSEVLKTLRRQEEETRSRAEGARSSARQLESRAEELLSRIGEAQLRLENLRRLTERRGVAAARLEDLDARTGPLEERVERLRDRLGPSPAPTENELAEAELRLERLRRLRDARPRLAGLLVSHEKDTAAAAERSREVEQLSRGPAYDGAAHESLMARRRELENLRGVLQNIRERIARRPDVEKELHRAQRQRQEAAERVEELRRELSALGFDEEAYRRARERAAEAERQRDEARQRRDEAEAELRELDWRLQRLEGDLERYREQRRKADEQAARASELKEMDALLGEFYRTLTGRVRPHLQREASALLDDLTDGRYSRMEFDDNYNIRLFDGLSDSYEVSRFSGGEADIASLCARVALSKMISDRGSGTLGFIVLDEVFGALDTDRRRNVLLALDRLKRTFGQIFIISHVGDVQESALLDEMWLVEEDGAGKSSVRRLNAASKQVAEILQNSS
ncbi:Chromosome partition protein Smc [Rubrobacter xylanophilus DSM 9941]|uniref:AAA family ATPase n=1 Tax=Rubrobacter xylanophilus TaxID=49319 RepID=UPI001C63BFB3|nr:SMC family ATPase [Rubrobacter xylanophilus]QYJ16687.1 Chromosome partition protein Smc [Rubrobacter xylanophilus DSM 9941]